MFLLKKQLHIIRLLSFFILFLMLSGCSTLPDIFDSLMNPSVEKNLNRINTGINLIRINNDILHNVPISVDAKWVDQIIDVPDYQENNINSWLKNSDPFYSTIKFTDMVKSKGKVSGTEIFLNEVSPTTIKMYNRIFTLYKKPYPDPYCFPKSIKWFREFPDARIKVIRCRKGSCHNNIEAAVIELTPDGLKEDLKNAKDEWNENINLVSKLKQECSELKAFIKDKSNKNSSDLESKKADLEVKKEELKVAETKADEKEDIFFALLKQASVELESNYDDSQIELANQVSKALKEVKLGSKEAIALFGIAGYGIYFSIGQLKEEIQTLEKVKASAWYNNQANQTLRHHIDVRKARLAKNAILALPNITLGSYFAYKQYALSSKYKAITNVITQTSDSCLAP